MRPPRPPPRRRFPTGAGTRAAGLTAALTTGLLALAVHAPGDAAPAAADSPLGAASSALPIGAGQAGPSVQVLAGVSPVAAALTTSVAAPAPPAAPAPAPAADLYAPSALAAGGIPSTALEAYHRAASSAPAGCHLDWTLLAAIGRVESNHGRFAGAVLHSDGLSTPRILGPRLDGQGTALIVDTDRGALDGDTVYDRAVGPMQFIPSTWARYARDGNRDGVADPFNVFDATRGAAAYLCAAGGDLDTLAGQQRAVLAYNHSVSYLATVLSLAATYAGKPPPALPVAPPAPSAPLPPVDAAPPPALGTAALAAPATTTPPGPATTTTPTTAATNTASPSATTDPTTPDPTTTDPTTTDPTTTSSAPTTTSPTTASPTTSTDPPSTVTDPPSTTTSTTTDPPGTASASASTSPPATPDAPVCPVDPTTGAPVVVDVLDRTGDPATAPAVTADLRAAGLGVGTVTSAPGTVGSAIEYATADKVAAGQLAGDLGLTALLQQTGVPHVTLVLGADDAAPLLTALHKAAQAPVCPAK